MNSAFFKKNWYLFTPAAILLIPALMMLFCMVNYGYGPSESMKAVLHFGSTSTRYAQGFSERKFKMVRVGMDGRSVYNTIKNPMERNMPEDTEWRYSLPGSGTQYYHERTLILEKDSNGIPRVKQRISRFHTQD
ncbi:hypothetical protein [Prosthecobacter sp.]|uniref:hypothetical protein n=1 Tax=Prosthecobacter sp. TaxID=1965333 RepID=UPI001DF62B1D|nr:hypothetical protein [Prosthecobacter sp.]MCB1278409.1 hypothetical protein [Prosthecobacter sp.]